MKRNVSAYPYIVWMLIFTIVPVLLIFYYSILNTDESGAYFTFEHFKRVFDPLYIMVLARSLWLALISTFVCLVIGYPMGMILAGKHVSKTNILVILFIIPMWTNFLARTYAWMTLLEKNGLIETFLRNLGLPPLNILYTDNAVILGMVYNFLPFMVLPIYSVLSKIERPVIEAAEDLGATPFVVFRRVIFPLSLPGVMSGVVMVFMPALTTFVISRLLGGGQFMLVGNLIEEQFLTTRNWGFGSALSAVLAILILISMAIMSKYDKSEERGRMW